MRIRLIFLVIIFIVTILSGAYPFIVRRRDICGCPRSFDFSMAESLAVGVFLGSGLMHMLSDSSRRFYELNYSYPIPFFMASSVFLLLLFLEHVGREIYEQEGSSSRSLAILAVSMLSFHSLLAGSALGLSRSSSVMWLVFLAITAHKWAASFALSVQINKTSLTLRSRIFLFAIFSIMAPLGIIFGSTVQHFTSPYPLMAPTFSSLAAGTFIYMGTLHGLEQGILVKSCCDLKNFSFVIVGFLIMSVVALWT
ncbi:ZIP family metal transporter [Candidatus Ichthyocystis hellenicum]|uniref:ZIP family metal transporter n=1 Tax=Candidatus Ichthyocystis hellenicum TaxID=1561003 RepID=UPI000AC24B02|nr:ZIP family metal transporter [Candidatus Ichthyocystis hellenicum]